MYSIPQSYQTHPQQDHMNTDQRYGHTMQTTNDQVTFAQNGNYSNEQVLVQQWNNNNGQSVEQTRQLSLNQGILPPAGQQLLHHQQQSLQHQYVTLNQGMQQYMPPQIGQQVTYQQQAPLSSHYIPSNNVISPLTMMNQPIVTSTPGPPIINNQMAQASKRQIDDVSKSCDTSINQQQTGQQRPQRQDSRYFTPKKLKTVTINGRNLNTLPTSSDQENTQRQRDEISSAACRFASTRYPYSPFLISFKTIVKDKLVIDELIKHAKVINVELKIVAYRHKQVENSHCILVFVENIDSFCFLTKDSNWPTHLCRETFVVKKPSTPPQLCVILPNVSLNTDWEEFIQDMKEQYHEVVEVIRLKNRSQHLVRTVKVEFSCAKARNDVLRQKEMSIDHMKYRVVEYFSPAQVLICGNCCEIGHFQKNCPHRDITICKICGLSCTDIKNHDCSGVPKCIRCGEDHKSTDSKCLVVKSYRAALTRNLLQQPAISPNGYNNAKPSQVDFPLAFAKHKQPFATTTSQTMELNLDTLLSKKLDSFLDEIRNESKKTRETIEDLREEMRKRDEESREKVEAVEKKVQVLEKELQDHMAIVNHVISNICLVLVNIENLAPENKKYFTSEAQNFKTLRSSPKRTECV